MKLISIQKDTSSPLGESLKNTIYKAFFKKGSFLFGVVLLLSTLFLAAPSQAQAGFFSGILRFLSGAGSESTDQASFSSVSMPLLGGQGAQVQPLAVGGPDDNSSVPISATGDSALVASRNPAGTLPNSQQDRILIYTVSPGDTPSSIAEQFGISLNTLLWANNIRNANLIKVGDELVILPVSGVKYEVRRGDTIETIAKKFKGDAGEILGFNGLAIGEELEAGSVIIIPDGELAPSPAVPSSRIASSAGLPEYRGYFLRPIIGGRRSRGLHGFNGIDLANSCGLPVLSSADGAVIIARSSGWNGGYGRYMVISHPNGTQTLYAHLASLVTSVGRHVDQGSTIGTIGSTGNSTGCHVHFEVRGAKNPF